MNWYLTIIFCIIILCVVIWKFPYLQEKYNAWKSRQISNWVLLHKSELPFLSPTVINAGEWHKVTKDSKAELNGIYLFICKGDNHLCYEVYEIPQGVNLMSFFSGSNEHSDSWAIVKPLYYYYVNYPITNV